MLNFNIKWVSLNIKGFGLIDVNKDEFNRDILKMYWNGLLGFEFVFG